jgi:hypothetical protein
VRRNEQAWKSDPTLAKAANALLSKRRGPNEHVFTQLKTWRIVHHDFPMGPRMYDITFRAIPYIHNIAREQLKST